MSLPQLVVNDPLCRQPAIELLLVRTSPGSIPFKSLTSLLKPKCLLKQVENRGVQTLAARFAQIAQPSNSRRLTLAFEGESQATLKA